MKLPVKRFLLVTLVFLFSSMLQAQCPFPSTGFAIGVAPILGSSVVIETCNFVGEYETVSDVVAGDTYEVDYSGGNGVFVVIYDSANTPIVWGNSPIQFTAAYSGIYYSSIFLDSLCGTSDFSCNASLWTNGQGTAQLQSLNPSTLSIAPNPTKDHVTISFEGNEASIFISDLRGKIVLSCQVKSGETIDLSSFDAGIYYFNMQIDGRNETVRIIHE